MNDFAFTLHFNAKWFPLYSNSLYIFNTSIILESDPNTPTSGTSKSVTQEAVKPHEKRALNFLVNEYLLCNSYKLTSITFSDENDDQVLFFILC